VQRLARWLDTDWHVFGVRFGWDVILGFIPVVGDVITAVLSLYIVYVGYRMSVPSSVLLKMLVNIGVEVLIGAVPGLGDIFDIYWRSNMRNIDLMKRSPYWETNLEKTMEVKLDKHSVFLGVLAAVFGGVLLYLIMNTMWHLGYF